MSKTYIKKFPVNHMRNVVAAIKAANREWVALNPEREKLPVYNTDMDRIIVQYGEEGRKRVDMARADLRAKESAIKAALESLVEHERAAYMEEVNEMFALRPEQLAGEKNSIEFQFLQLGLLETPDDVRNFIQRNVDNPTLVKLACRYADTQSDKMDNLHDKLEWKTISAENITESALRKFENWFTEVGIGCAHDPAGYYYMLVTHKSDPQMEIYFMENYELLEEYSAATGVPTDSVSVFYALSGNGSEETPGDAQEGAEQTE